MAKIEGPLMSYVHKGMECCMDKELVEKWMLREGIRKGTSQFYEAMECVMVNARGRLESHGMPVTEESLRHAAEEVIKEEIELTGGEA